MPVDHIPKSTRIRIGRHPFKHDSSSTTEQGTIDDVGVTRDPAYICCTAENIAILILKYVSECVGGIDHIACGSVQHPFRFAGRAGGIEDEERVFGIHRYGSMGIVYFGDLIVPP